MPRHLPLVLVLVAAVALPAEAATKSKRKSDDFGFLPGYRPPDVVDRQERLLYWRRHPTYWYGWPGFYRGRWNGGGFGPCWTQTPIGNVWNCGK